METRCDGCGSPVSAEQAFCPRCGAVIGMADAGEHRDEGWDMQTTMVGRKPSPKPAPLPAPAQVPPAEPAEPAEPAPVASRDAATPAKLPGAALATEPARESRGISTLLLAVIGFVAVLLIGGLLLLLR
jgi:predicted component of type VI protein secretion system